LEEERPRGQRVLDGLSGARARGREDAAPFDTASSNEPSFDEASFDKELLEKASPELGACAIAAVIS
jgi:hypothetical protein